MNFAKGILESRVQTYKHLKTLLKTIPLETPTIIELSPGDEIEVTLFDADHCVGAVMFLVQGQGKAILYTGDVRAETWWVNSLVQNPVLLPYASGHKRLDKIYLDTTFATRSRLNREFPSKAEGLRELLTKVSNYPPATIFHFEAWTFGYENVWVALSTYLDSQVHLDRYRWRLYKSLATANGLPQCPEAPPLVGFQLGNHSKLGCLTSNPHVRLHSCERGTPCPEIDDNSKVVRIIPIVKRLRDGTEIAEAGIGGGKGDLDQIHELETHDPIAIGQLMQLCAAKLKDQETLSRVLRILSSAMSDRQGRIRLFSSRDMWQGDQAALDEMPLQQFVEMLARVASDTPASASSAAPQTDQTQHVSAARVAINTPAVPATADQGLLSRVITFPWARHASYTELCQLVQAFRPRDVHPCTVDELTWTPEVSMKALFGQYCSDDVFAHDREMMEEWARRENGPRGEKRKQQETQETQNSDESRAGQRTPIEENPLLAQCIDSSASQNASKIRLSPSPALRSTAHPENRGPDGSPPTYMRESPDLLTASDPALPTPLPAASSAVGPGRGNGDAVINRGAPPPRSIRQWAGTAAKNLDDMSWSRFGGLVCTGNGHTEEELEL